MRIVALELLAFGPFSGTRIDFAAPSPGLHVVFGPNEAGKSTTLRAVLGLLFGIPARTQDAHRHAMKDLRVGAVLERGAGQRIEVVRRKGRKDTLLDPDGRPMGEDALGAFLGGVSGPLFESAFGLDHVSLRAGAEAMLAGRGDVGESLFGASAGGIGVRRLLDRLGAEADALFTPRGRSRKAVVQSIAAVREQRRVLDNATMHPEGYSLQKRALDEATVRRDALRARHAALKAEQSRLLRLLKVMLPLAQREHLAGELAALGDVPDLGPDTRELRLSVEEALRSTADEMRRLGETIAQAEQRMAAFDIPEVLRDLDPRVIKDIDERLARHRAAVIDLPKVQGKLQAAREDVDKGRSAVGLSAEQALGQRPPAPLVARVRTLAREMARLGADVEHAGREVTVKRVQKEELERRLAAVPEVVDASALEAVIASIEERGDPEQRLVEAEDRLAELGRACERAVAELGADWSMDAVRSFRPPPPEAVDAAERLLSELGGRFTRAEERRESFRARLIEAEREIDALSAQGDVPTEDQLAEARGRRGRALGSARQKVEQGASVTHDDLDALETRIDEADVVADRLRREADRAARMASLSAERKAAARGLSAAEEHLGAIEAERRAAQARWEALFADSGRSVAGPLEIRGFLARFREASRAVRELDDAAVGRQHLRERLAEARARLAEAERAFGLSSDGALSVRLGRAKKWLAAVEQRRMQRKSTEDALCRATEELSASEALRSGSQSRLAEWRQSWGQAMNQLGRPEETPPDEALALLDALGDLWARVDVADGLRRRLEGMERDSRGLAKDVMAVCRRVLPEACELDPFEAAAVLVRRHAQALADDQARAVLSGELAEARARLADAERRRDAALERRAALCRAAGVADPEQLEVVERRVEAARRLRRQLEELEQSIIQAGDGAQISELIAETRQVDADEAKSRLNEIDSELEEIEDERERVAQDVATIAHGLERYGGGEAAAAAVELQLRAARLETEVRKYLATRLSVAVLSREVERFRERHQGPVLSRAAEIFPKLTLGRYTGLRIGFAEDDRACLRCVRSDETEVGVESLSDGTRDQLYLALRLSTLERQATAGEPMPLLLDDALVHFDDERAAAALAVLGETSRTSQVLFFTHHARLVELAEAAVPADQLAVHRLSGAAP